MKTSIASILLIFICSLYSNGQELTQTVRGTILDADSKMELIGASVVIIDSDPILGGATDVNGKFRIDGVPIGRISLKLSYLGYETIVIPNITVNSGKEVVLNLEMQESTVKMDEVVVSATQEKGEALNDMAMVSARSISPDETSKHPGGFNDPSRIVSNFAGVTTTQDGGNNIIVRGNSPKYIQWRLEGVQISNPNHFADQGAVGGSVSILNNNMLAASDFYTGAFAPEYGDVLSGVYDVKLRAGNNEKFESVFGFGLLGTDLTFEGPFKKGYGGSYLVNYRYSTVSLINDLGLVDIGGTPKFQDGAFKLVFPSKKVGTFSLFGIGGYSSLLLEDVTPDVWETPGDNFMNANITEDFGKDAYLYTFGLNHTIPISKRSFLKTTFSYAGEGIEDRVYEEKTVQVVDDQGAFVKDSIASKGINFKNDLLQTTYRAATTWNTKLNAKNKIKVGTKYAYFTLSNDQSQLNNEGSRTSLIDFNEGISTVRNFVSWKHRLNDKITFVTGLHNMNVLLNNKSTVEPRLAVNWKVGNLNTINAGYGMHSTMERVHNYYTKIEHQDGSFSEPNKDLDLLKAHHFVLGYQRKLTENLSAKLEVYYQYLYNIPVENNDTSYYSTLNEGLDPVHVDLVNEGKGENYGVELTLERFFNNNYYYMFNTSVFSSTYESLEGKTRNTKYNGDYVMNLIIGKDFPNLGKNKNRSLSLNAKVYFGGGQKIVPLLRDNSGGLAVDPDNNKYWDYQKAYEDKIEDVYHITLSASYKFNNPKGTHEIFLDLNNITDNQSRLSEFYDESEPNSIGYLRQFGVFPNLMYRVYF